jgi:FlaA1/EpsC-like NDP-sugar epimerase
MEHVLLSPTFAAHPRRRISTARFANVAFSDGSLLAGWRHRIAKRQPIPVPVETRRYFISDAEAAQICVIAVLLDRPNFIVIPTLEKSDQSVLLEDVAVRFIEAHGYAPKRYDDPAQAVASLANDVRAGRYPLLLTPLDTEGEKPIEQFVAPAEQTVPIGLPHLLGVSYGRPPAAGLLRNVVARIQRLIDDPGIRVTKEELVELVGSAVPELRHSATGKLLDQRL